MSGQVITSAGQSIFPGEYVVGLGRLDNALAAGLTDGSVQILPVEPSQTSRSSFKAHENTILGLEVIENAGVIATCGSDSVKLWDVRAGNKNIHKFTLEGRKNPLTCLAASGHRLAVGTELKDQDAGVVVWDVRTCKPVVSYMESHNDDVTMVGFHPTDTNGLISGSTDGLVNLYNTSITDEDDALFQTVNHGASIHKAGFLSEKRLFALSHMETMAIYSVYDADEDKEEMSGKVDLGDLRGLLSCDYVADILNGYVAVGKDNELRLVPLANEQFQLDNAITLKGGHGEEVIRSLLLDATNSMVITGGEDGIVRYWRASILNQEHTANDAKMDEDEGEQQETEKTEKKHKHKHKHHNHHTAGDDKHDKDWKRKKHKHKDKKDKKAGFKPY